MVSRRALAIVTLTFLVLLGWSARAQRRAVGAVMEKPEWSRVWTVPVSSVRAMVARPPGLLLIGDSAVGLVGADGSLTRQKTRPPIALGTTGDLDGDGADEVVLAGTGPSPRIEALDPGLEPAWSVTLAGAAEAARLLVVDLDGDGRREVVVGDARGTLHALSGAARPLWKRALASAAGEDAAVRGLDDVRTGKGESARRVAFALRGGPLGVVDGKGKTVWTASGDKVRRLRTVDLDGDATSEVLTGHEQGGITAWSAAGRTVFATTLGESVTELRAVEVDGNPSRPEVAAGSKRGAVRVLRGGGAMWIGSVPGRVSAIGGVDLDGDGRDAVFVGTEEGGLSAFEADGRPLGSEAAGGKVEAIAGVASPLRDRLAVVAAGPAVTAWRITRRRAPAWYGPESAAVLGGLAVIASGLALRRLRPPPAQAPPAALDGAALGRKALEDAAARISSLVGSGRVTREGAADRLQQIQHRLDRARSASAAPSPATTFSPSPPPPPKRGRG